MKINFIRLVVFTVLATSASQAILGDDPIKEDGWLSERNAATGVVTMTRELTLHPQPEPKPALKIRLLPDEFDLLDGNAAVYYLKALGFLEQSMARDKIRDLHKSANAKAMAEQIDLSKVAPYSYPTMAPNELPKKEVKEFLDLLRFQSPFLEEARKLRSFTLDRNIRQVKDPVAYLLPEVQSMRELARNQSVRCRFAVAEGRIEDAMKIVGQQIAMAKHLGTDEFYVSALVGIAINNLAWNDALYLIEHPNTPNLYWAYSTLPSPLIDLTRAHAFERQFLFEQVKVLREVDETIRPAGYWLSFVDRFIDQSKGLGLGETSVFVINNTELQRAGVVAMIAASYPAAKRYLTELGDIPVETIEAYPIAQTVFLAGKKYYEQARDELFKTNYLPPAQAILYGRKSDAKLQEESPSVGHFASLSTMFLPAIASMREAHVRMQQSIALIQTIEAIRMYGAAHQRTLPASLNDLPVPAPNDPLSGVPFDYEVNSDYAVLSGKSFSRIGYRFVIRFAPPSNR